MPGAAEGKAAEGDAWIYEIKWDGYRLSVHVGPTRIRILTRDVCAGSGRARAKLLIVLRVAVRPSWGRLLSVAAGIASGAAMASYLAAIGATSLSMLDDLDMWTSVVLSSILLYSAVRLARLPIAGAPPQQLGSDSLSLRLYSLGLATALSNPLSVPFFVGLYLAQPDFRTDLGDAASCIIFHGLLLVYVGGPRVLRARTTIPACALIQALLAIDRCSKTFRQVTVVNVKIGGRPAHRSY
ncbi:threonine/homoserine/homoserine lactone efflux protein [Rhizobium leguminosarum]